MFSVGIFQNSVVGQECSFRYWAIEMESERWIVSLLYRGTEVKWMYILLFSEIQSLNGHLNWFIMFVFCRTSIKGEELLFITKLKVLNLL